MSGPAAVPAGSYWPTVDYGICVGSPEKMEYWTEMIRAYVGAMVARYSIEEVESWVWVMSVPPFLSFSLSLSLSLSLSVSLSVCLSVSLSLSVSLPVSLCLSVRRERARARARDIESELGLVHVHIHVLSASAYIVLASFVKQLTTSRTGGCVMPFISPQVQRAWGHQRVLQPMAKWRVHVPRNVLEYIHRNQEPLSENYVWGPFRQREPSRNPRCDAKGLVPTRTPSFTHLVGVG